MKICPRCKKKHKDEMILHPKHCFKCVLDMHANYVEKKSKKALDS